MLKRGLKVFGEQGVVTSKAELTQMHQRVCFTPELIKNLSELERKRAMKGLMILTQKRDGRKGVPQNIFNGNDRLFRGTTWWGT